MEGQMDGQLDEVVDEGMGGWLDERSEKVDGGIGRQVEKGINDEMNQVMEDDWKK